MKERTGRLLFGMAFLSVFLGVTPAAAAQIVVIPPARDNTLIEWAPGPRSNGSGPYLFAGRVDQDEDSIRRGVLAFDLAGHVPPGARILRAALVLHVDRTGDRPGPVALHRLLGDWGEGASAARTGRGAPAAPGDATWDHTFFDTAFWGTPGGDFVPRASAVGRDVPGGFVVLGSTAGMIHDLQAWLDGPEGDFGWLLRGDESQIGTVVAFDARESPAAALRPMLVVQYARGRPQRGAAGRPGGEAPEFAAALSRLFGEGKAAPRSREAAFH